MSGVTRKGAPYDEFVLGDPKWTEEALVDLMLEQPIPINRPIVVTPLGVGLCRPSETVLGIPPEPQRGVFAKEGGEAVPDASGRRNT